MYALKSIQLKQEDWELKVFFTYTARKEEGEGGEEEKEKLSNLQIA